MERLVLKEHADLAALTRAAADLGWHATPPGADRQAMVAGRFAAPDGGNAVWVADPATAHTYLLVPSPTASPWRRALAAQDVLLDLPAALATAESATTPEQARAAVALLGLYAYGPFDPRVYARITAGLASGDDGVRAEALSAVTMSGWPEFGAALRAVPAASGADPAWQREADDIAAAMEANGWNRDFYAADPPGP